MLIDNTIGYIKLGLGFGAKRHLGSFGNRLMNSRHSESR